MRTPTDFDYHYFDDPNAHGYQGYERDALGDQITYPWEAVASYCERQGVTSAVDLGCAKGFLVEVLIKHGIAAQGFDISEYALSFARTLPCQQRDVRDGIPVSADAIIATGVLIYLHESELSSVLSDIYQSTRLLFILSAHYEGDRQVIPDAMRRITRPRSWWRSTIESHGFSFRHHDLYFDAYAK